MLEKQYVTHIDEVSYRIRANPDALPSHTAQYGIVLEYKNADQQEWNIGIFIEPEAISDIIEAMVLLIGDKKEN